MRSELVNWFYDWIYWCGSHLDDIFRLLKVVGLNKDLYPFIPVIDFLNTLSMNMERSYANQLIELKLFLKFLVTKEFVMLNKTFPSVH